MWDYITSLTAAEAGNLRLLLLIIHQLQLDLAELNNRFSFTISYSDRGTEKSKRTDRAMPALPQWWWGMPQIHTGLWQPAVETGSAGTSYSRLCYDLEEQTNTHICKFNEFCLVKFALFSKLSHPYQHNRLSVYILLIENNILCRWHHDFCWIVFLTPEWWHFLLSSKIFLWEIRRGKNAVFKHSAQLKKLVLMFLVFIIQYLLTLIEFC